jgi:hypothetical protein
MTKEKTAIVMVNRNLQLPKFVWDALDEDAERCGRSGVKQLLALLIAHYDLGNVELDKEGLERMRMASIPLGGKHPSNESIPTKHGLQAVPPGPVINASTRVPKKGGRSK